MRTWIKRLLAPPVFEGDEDKTRTAWLLNIILLALLARAVLIRLLTWYQDLGQTPRPSFFWSLTILLLGVMVLMRRGYVRLASTITVVGFWLSLSAVAVINDGIRSSGFRNYIIPVLIAGLLLGRRAAITMAGLSILAGLSMWLAEINGVMPEPLLLPATSLELFVTHAISLLMAAVLVTLAKRNIEEALARARREITERRQTEETLRASEERFSKAFNLSPLRMGIVRIEDGVILDVNDRWVREMGFAREEVIGRLAFELKNWVGEEAPRIQQLLKEGQSFRDQEFQVNTNHGERRIVLGSAEVIEISGEPCFLFAGHDITERKRAEEALRLSEERFAKMFQASPESASVYRYRDGVLLEVNQRWTSVFGYTREEAIGHTALELNLVTPEYRQRLRQLLEEHGSIHEFKAEFKNKSGEARHVIVSVEQIVIQGEPCIIYFHRDITERQLAEEALRRNEELFRAIVEDQTEMIVRWKPDGTRTFVNQAYCRVFGGSAEQFVGSSFFPLVSEKDLPRVHQKIRSLTPANPVATHVHESISPTGQPCWQEWTDRGIFDAEGQLVELQSTGRDITERKRAEEALRESEEVFRTLAETVSAGIYIHRDMRYVYVNPAAERLTGYTRDEFLKMDLLDVIHPDFRQQVMARVAARQRGELLPLYFEDKILTKSGEVRWMEVTSGKIQFRGQGATIVTTFDITERKQAEEALRESEELFRTSFEHATAGVCLVGTDGRFLSVNQTLCEMIGYTNQELERLSFNDITPDEDKHIGAAFVAQAISGGASSAHFEKRYLHKNGQVIWAYVSTALVHQPGGKPHYFISYIQDITERKRAETERLGLMHDLGERVKELTALHRTARLLQEERPFDLELLSELVAWLPPAWQYPEVCEARITYADLEVRTPAWRETPWKQIATFTTNDGQHGTVEVVYLEEQPAAAEGPFLTEERHLIQSLADMLTAHLERKQAEKQIKATSEQLRALMASLRSAKEQEGMRIAREIHDELGSALTSLRWDLEEIDKTVAETEGSSLRPAWQEKVGAMFGLIDTTINVVRRISSELRPSVLDDLGLVEAIEWQAQQFQARTGIRCQYDCAIASLDLDQERSTAVFRIFQEALTNVLRHAQATSIEVKLEEAGAQFMLQISDNGRGITEGEKSGTFSLGLLGMQERAHLIGGKVEITSVQGQGTTVTLCVPNASAQSVAVAV